MRVIGFEYYLKLVEYSLNVTFIYSFLTAVTVVDYRKNAMETKTRLELQIIIKQTGQREHFLQYDRDKNGLRLTVSVYHGNKSVKESLKDIGCGWNVEIERKSTKTTVPYVLKLLRNALAVSKGDWGKIPLAP